MTLHPNCACNSNCHRYCNCNCHSNREQPHPRQQHLQIATATCNTNGKNGTCNRHGNYNREQQPRTATSNISSGSTRRNNNGSVTATTPATTTGVCCTAQPGLRASEQLPTPQQQQLPALPQLTTPPCTPLHLNSLPHPTPYPAPRGSAITRRS